MKLHVIALAMVCASLGARAQHTFDAPSDVTAFLEQVDAKLHSPWAEMDEFCAEVSMTGLFLPGSTIRYLWRKQATSEVRLEGQPNPAIEHILHGALREDGFDKVMHETALPPMLEKYRGCELSLSEEGDLHRLDVLSHRPDTVFRQQTVWFDEQLLPVRYESDNVNPTFGGYHESTRLFYEEIAGHWVPTLGISESDHPSTPPVPIESVFEWEQIGEHFVVTGVTMQAVDGETRTIMFQVGFDDIRIDQGFGDPPTPGTLKFLAPSRSRIVTLGESEGPETSGLHHRLGLAVEQTGPITVTALSISFSPGLSLRDADGDLVGRSEGAGSMAVLHAEVTGGSAYTLDVSRPDGLPGDVKVSWAEGSFTPEPPDDGTVTELVGHVLGRSRQASAAARFDEAEVYARLAIAVTEQHFSQLGALHAEAQLELSESLGGKGLFADALLAVDLAIEIFDGLQNPLWLNAHIARAECLLDAGRLAEARTQLESCLAYAEDFDSGMGGMLRSSLTYKLAALSLDQGRFPEAEEAFREILDTALIGGGEEGRLTLLTRDQLANALFEQGLYDQADEQLAIASRTSLRSRGIHHGLTLNLLLHRTQVAQAQGDYDLAAESLADLFDLREAEVGDNDPLLLFMIGELARVELARGELELAREWTERRLAGVGQVFGDESAFMADALDDLADLLLAEGQPAAALAKLAESAQRRRSPLERELTALTEQQRLQWAATQRGVVDRLVGRCLQLQGTDLAGLVYDEVRNWKGLVSRGLLQERRWLQRGADPELQSLVQRLRRTVSQLSAGVLNGQWQAPEQGEQTMDVESLLAERRDLQERIARRSTESSAGTATTQAQIQAAIQGNEALVDLVIVRGQNSRRAAAFVVRAEGPVALVDLGPASVMGAAVAKHLGQIEAGRGVLRDMRGRSHGAPRRPTSATQTPGLEALLWEPLRIHLEGAERVFICPEAELATLPFETIAGETAGTFLIEERAFVYLQSAADLLATREPRRAGGKIVVLGGVNYNAPTGAGMSAESSRDASAAAGQEGAWPPLPGTEIEARDIAALSSGQTVELLIDEGASELALREAVKGARVVHLATHGYFAPADVASPVEGALATQEFAGLLPGLLSGIVLAGANGPNTPNGDDGLLTAEEAAWLDLSACELVVLSACETGLGTPSGGENLIGLRRAFYLAGAESRITSLWKVEDDSTRQLMLDFYRRRIHEGQERGQALRGAQLAMLERQRSEAGGLPLPSTWGAFVLEGAWW